MKDINDLFEQTLLPALEELEERRKKVIKNKISIFFIAFIILSIHGLIILLHLLPIYTIIISIILVPIIAFLVLKYFFSDNALEEDYKSLVISQIINYLVTVIGHDPTGYLPYEEFQKSNFFSTLPDHYTGSNLAMGMLGKLTTVMFSEIEAAFEGTENKANIKDWITIFKGIFLVASLKHHFSMPLVMMPDDTQKTLGILGRNLQQLNFHRGKTVRIGNQPFEKQFAVYAEKPLEAAEILSADIVEQILDFKKRTGLGVYLSCIDNNVYVAVNNMDDVLQFSLWRSLLRIKPITLFYEELAFMLQMAKTINTKFSMPDEI